MLLGSKRLAIFIAFPPKIILSISIIPKNYEKFKYFLLQNVFFCMNFSTNMVENIGIHAESFFAVKNAPKVEIAKPARLIAYSKRSPPKFAPPAEINMMVAIVECDAK